jgi:hypothetical protein
VSKINWGNKKKYQNLLASFLSNFIIYNAKVQNDSNANLGGQKEHELKADGYEIKYLLILRFHLG